jgi:hypothetical protein
MNTERDREHQSHDPTGQWKGSSTLSEAERLVDDLDAFCLEVNRSKDCGTHDTDSADNRFGEEKPNWPGQHGGGEG